MGNNFIDKYSRQAENIGGESLMEKRWIYQVKEKFNIQVDEEGIEAYEVRDIKPKLLAIVPVIIPKEQTFIDEEGIETTFIPELDIQRYYPKWDSNLMVAEEINTL